MRQTIGVDRHRWGCLDDRETRGLLPQQVEDWGRAIMGLRPWGRPRLGEKIDVYRVRRMIGEIKRDAEMDDGRQEQRRNLRNQRVRDERRNSVTSTYDGRHEQRRNLRVRLLRKQRVGGKEEIV